MINRPLAPREPDDVLEALAARIAGLARSAALLDSVGRREEASVARADAAELALLLDLLRSPGEDPPGAAPSAH